MANTKDSKSGQSDAVTDSTAERPETGFRDISDAVEQAQVDDQRPALDPETGEANPQVSEAAAEVAQEMAYRASGSFNGGGPWPPDLLREVGTTQGRALPPVEQYTSHEEG